MPTSFFPPQSFHLRLLYLFAYPLTATRSSISKLSAILARLIATLVAETSFGMGERSGSSRWPTPWAFPKAVTSAGRTSHPWAVRVTRMYAREQLSNVVVKSDILVDMCE